MPSVLSLSHVDEAGDISVLINSTGRVFGSDTVVVESLLQEVPYCMIYVVIQPKI